ncbi:MAG TPA: iron-containing alcohol dehydrogenase [Polyangia bacterium]
MPLEFRTAGRVIFGAGTSAQVPELCAGLGQRLLLVTGGGGAERGGGVAALLAALGAAGGPRARVRVPREPDVALVDGAARAAVEAGCDVVLGVGGGSVLDAAKAVAALATNGGSARDYLEDIGAGHPRVLTAPALPAVLVPTTAGTGSEVTRNAVVGVPDRGVKRSMRGDRLLPRVAVVDPTLAAAAPRPVAAAAGLDALIQLFEAFVSRAAQPLTDALIRDGLPRAARALRALAAGAATAADWEDLSLASLYGGMALANAGLGAAHGLAAPLGGRLGVPHGVACAALIPGVIRANVAALGADPAGAPARRRYAEAAALVTPDASPDPARAAAALDGLRRALDLPAVTALVAPAAVPAILAECRGGSMKANPVTLDDAALARVLTEPLAG